MIDKVSKYVNANIRTILTSQEEYILKGIYEIRLRINCPVYLKTTYGDYFITYNKKSTNNVEGFYTIKKNDISSTISALTSNSIHAYEKEIERGYITIEGGHRVGIGGDCLYDNNKFKGFKNITSLNIRIAKDYIGCSNNVLKYIIRDSKNIFNTLIAGPPLSGKTTCIRDISRNLSDGFTNPMFSGCDLTIIDERGEIAAIHNGVPQVYVGSRTDLLSYCMKKEGFNISIRSLAPRVVVSDELGSIEDFSIIQYALKSGIKIVSTAHAGDISDLFKNIYIKNILGYRFIERIIVLDDKNPITIKQVYDNINGRILYDAGS